MGVSYESFISVQTENAKLKTINTELLEALEEIQEAFKCPYGNVNPRWIESHVAEAIRKAKE